MKHFSFFRISFLALIILLFLSAIVPLEKISLNMESQSLKNGKKSTVTAEIFYKPSTGIMTIHYLKPIECVFISNAKGEAKIYYPAKNEVYLTQSVAFDTEKSLLYYFLSNKTSDLGLKDLGFTLSETKYEDKMLITTWKAPFSLAKEFSKVELVSENYVPIYLGYYNASFKLVKKIYYYQYSQIQSVKLPLKVVEFNYLPDGDSVVNRIVYSDVRLNEQANSPYFNFKVPENAKIAK